MRESGYRQRSSRTASLSRRISAARVTKPPIFSYNHPEDIVAGRRLLLEEIRP